ncbi:MAG: OFA family MFS transporter [Candidatus Bipolaricaulota bacterium]|nr:OFA family MFS transporter [Candidatus Bipolaricaulota bacterium]
MQSVNRWVYVGLGFLINVCAGAVYAYSVFRKPLEELWGIGATQSGLPFLVFLAMFALGMALAGRAVARWGPRRMGIVGGAMVGAGWILAGFSPNIAVLTLLYGVLGGLGVGVVYGCPIAVVGRWFPDRRGLAVGLALAGFGASALVVAPLMNALILAYGPLRTFTLLGIAFFALMTLGALPLRFPPAEFGVNGLSHTASSAHYTRRAMVRTRAFLVLWTTFTLGCLAGLMAIGIAAPFGREVAHLTPALSAVAVSTFALFNGLGRPLFGWLTDRLTPRHAAVLSFALILLAALLLEFEGQYPAVYFLGFALLWFNLGGWLAIAPAATATFFGTEHYAENYGLMFTAYGVGAILGNVLSGVLRDFAGSYLAVFPPVMGLAVAGIVLAWFGLKAPASQEA